MSILCNKCSNERALNAEGICAMCVARAEAAGDEVEGAEVASQTQKQEDNVIEIAAQGPAVSARITITLYEDGNAQVDGPFEDRILFKGLIGIALDVERDMYAQKRVQAMRQAIELQKMPWWKRKLLQRKQKKAAEERKQKEDAARRDAERLAASSSAAGPQ